MSVEPGLVSIIIPTYKRYPQVRRAAASAVAQTFAKVEVLVISDGHDPRAQEAVDGLGPRLAYYEVPVNTGGPAAARNLGVAHARGEWLTFLDDDDIMLPHCIERQYPQVSAAEPRMMSACRVIYRHSGREDVWPERPIGPDEDVGDYLVLRPSLLGRPGILPMQCLLLHHSIVARAPLTDHPEHEDWAWVLDAVHLAGARVKFLWEPLVVYNLDTTGNSRSGRTNWHDSLAWALTYRKWLTPRAFNSFLSSKVALKAKRAGSWQGLRKVFRLLRGNGATLLEWAFFSGICLLPGAVLHRAWKRSLGRKAE